MYVFYLYTNLSRRKSSCHSSYKAADFDTCIYDENNQFR